MEESPKSAAHGGAVPVFSCGSRTGRLTEDGAEECARIYPSEERCTPLAWAVVQRLIRVDGVDVLLAIPPKPAAGKERSIVVSRKPAAVIVECADGQGIQAIEMYPTRYPVAEGTAARIREALASVIPGDPLADGVQGESPGRLPRPIKEGGKIVSTVDTDGHSAVTVPKPTGPSGPVDIDYPAWLMTISPVGRAMPRERALSETATPARRPRLELKDGRILGTFFGPGSVLPIDIYPKPGVRVEQLLARIRDEWERRFGTDEVPVRPALPVRTDQLSDRSVAKTKHPNPLRVVRDRGSVPPHSAICPERTTVPSVAPDDPVRLFMQKLETWLGRRRGVHHAALESFGSTDGPRGNSTEIAGAWVVLTVRAGGVLGAFRVYPRKGVFESLTPEGVLTRLAEELLEQLRFCPLLDQAPEAMPIRALEPKDQPASPGSRASPTESRRGRASRTKRIGPPDPPAMFEPTYRHLVEREEARWIGDDLTIDRVSGRILQFYDGMKEGKAAFMYLVRHDYLMRRPDGLFTIRVVPGYVPKAARPRDGTETAAAPGEAGGVTFFTGVPAAPRRRTQPARPEPAPGALSMPRPDPFSQEAVRPEAEAGQQVVDDEQVDNPVGVVPAEPDEKGETEDMKRGRKKAKAVADGPTIRGRPMTYDDMPEDYRPVYRTALKSGRANSAGTWVDLSGFWSICAQPNPAKAGQVYSYFMSRGIACVISEEGAERVHRVAVLPGYSARLGGQPAETPPPAEKTARRPRRRRRASAQDELTHSAQSDIIKENVDAIRGLADQLRKLGCEVKITIKVPAVELEV